MARANQNAYGLGWIFRQTKGIRPYLALFTIMVLIAKVGELSIAYFLKLFIDIATGESDASLLAVGFTAMAVLGIGSVFIMLNSVFSKYIYGKTERKLRTELLGVIFSRRMADISKQHTGDLLTKLTVDVQAVSECFPIIINDMIGGGVSALVATVAIFFLNWKMALIMLGLTPLLMLVMGVLVPYIEKMSLIDKENDERNRSLMQESLSRIMLVKAYFMLNKTVSHVHAAYAQKLKSGMKLGMWEGLTTVSGMMMGLSMFMVTMGVGAYFVMQGETTFGNMVAIVQLLNYIVEPIAKFVATVSLVGQAKASSGRIGSVIDLPADQQAAAIEPVEAVELIANHIRFLYDEKNVVLENCNARFAKGFVTGLVGKSGSGKSTLLKLLIGLYAPQQGSVSLKHACGTMHGEEIMTQVAYVPPVDYLFSGTVTENIIMSEKEPRLEEMRQAAAGANILEFIESLPEGFDTQIGESGGTVSSGQAQRIAIARAIYKRSPIVVFDEPTANLDVGSIEKFQSAVKKLAKDKICIVVTHDESTMSVCDKVYVLEDGNVSEMEGAVHAS